MIYLDTILGYAVFLYGLFYYIFGVSLEMLVLITIQQDFFHFYSLLIVQIYLHYFYVLPAWSV